MKSIRRQLTRDLMLALATLLGAGLLAIGVAVWWALSDSFDATLRARAMAVGALSEIEEGKAAFDFSEDFLRSYGAEKPRNYFEIRDRAGNLLVRSPSLRNGGLPREDAGSERARFWNLTLPNGRPGRAVELTVTPVAAEKLPAGSPLAQMRLVVASDREEFNETLVGLFAGVASCGGLLIVAVFVVVPRVLRRGLRPLDALGERAAGIDADSLATRFPIEGLPSELQPIAERLNGLLARLELSFERERRFSADLAHELRTPLAELRTLTECAVKWPETRDAATDRETLAIAAQMEITVSRMLALARSDRGQLPVKLAEFDLEALVQDAWRSFATRATARRIAVRWSHGRVRATGDAALLRSILANLFDNAVDYAPEDAVIEIIVGGEAGRPFVRVANRAPDLAAADVARLFDRFWRKEAARSGGGAHLGLGLPLAQAFAQAMSWSLTAALEDEARLVFTLAPTGHEAPPSEKSGVVG